MHITDASLWNRKLTAFVGFIYDAVHTRDGHAVADFVGTACSSLVHTLLQRSYFYLVASF